MNDSFKGLSLAQGHTREMNAARENAERWSEAVGKLTAEKDAEIERLTAEKRLLEIETDKITHLEQALATERAAREKAENSAMLTRSKLQATEDMRGLAERERNSALARVKELEGRMGSEFTHDQLLHEVSSYRSGMMAAESALASANQRVKELEPWEKRYDKLNGQYEWQAEQLMMEYDRRVAAETALLKAEETLKSQALELASARTLLVHWLCWRRGKVGREPLTSDTKAWLSSAPSPARCSGCAAARELLAQWLRSFPHLRSARLGVRTEEWITSHPVPVAEPLSGEQLAERYGFKPHGQWVVGCDFGAGDAPVAAPCAGCAAARELIQAGYCGFNTKQCEEADAWLTSRPAPVADTNALEYLTDKDLRTEER